MKASVTAQLKTKHFKEKITLRTKNSFLRKRIKVQLDHKTVIMINRLSSLEVWKRLFPNAHIIG